MIMMPHLDPLFILSGFIVGLLVGQTGVGGGSLMTPLLVLLFGVHPATAVGTDLLYAAVTKSAGTVVHGMHHTVDWRITRRLATGSVPATLLTLYVMSHYDMKSSGGAHVIAVVLGVMLLLTALSIIFRTQFTRLMAPFTEGLTPRRAARLTVGVGVALGVLVTISSVGAGALGVTALLLLYPRHKMAVIVGSDIAHAVPLTLVAGIGHWFSGSVDWGMLTALLCGSIPGIVLGSYMSAKVPEGVLRSVLAAVLFIVGGRLVL
jgi:uncharacterized membrane protein YfcA